MWHFEQLPTGGSAEHGFHNHNSRLESSLQRLQVCVRPGKRQERPRAVLSCGKRNCAKTSQIPPVVWLRPDGRDAGWASWATVANREAWDDFTPSQSSVVSQLTSRGTWRHLVPVWMTVTVEGRGRVGSSKTGGSSRSGEGSSEFWLYTLTVEGKGAMEGPAGEAGSLFSAFPEPSLRFG